MDEEYEEEKGWEGDMGEIDVSLKLFKWCLSSYNVCIQELKITL